MNSFSVVCFQIALKFAQKNQKVLFIARRPLDRLPFDDDDSNAPLSANILRNIIFRYANTVDELRKAVLELHTWGWAPRLLIIDSLQEFFIDEVATNDGRDDYELCAHSTPTNYTQFCEAHCIITAATQNAVDSMSCRLLRSPCASIISIDFDAVPSLHRYYERFRTRYFELYYFDGLHRYHASEDNLNALHQKVIETLN